MQHLYVTYHNIVGLEKTHYLHDHVSVIQKWHLSPVHQVGKCILSYTNTLLLLTVVKPFQVTKRKIKRGWCICKWSDGKIFIISWFSENFYHGKMIITVIQITVKEKSLYKRQFVKITRLDFYTPLKMPLKMTVMHLKGYCISSQALL